MAALDAETHLASGRGRSDVATPVAHAEAGEVPETFPFAV